MGHEENSEAPSRGRTRQDNALLRFFDAVVAAVDAPVVWFRETIVVPNQKDYNWYHRKYRRVPTIDQCYNDDFVCIFEADQQFFRDKRVESALLNILKRRVENCHLYEEHLIKEKCPALQKEYDDAVTNWFIKYGDLGAYATSRDAYMKQKHRLIWERRYGAVGTGNVPLSERQPA